MNNTVLVIGAGPAGMMAAGIAAKNGSNVILIEKNKRVGRKLMITGKGRCNITNNCDINDFISCVPCNGNFLYSAINSFTPQDTISFFESHNLSLKIERGNRVFPESDRAIDVVDALYKFVKDNKCKIIEATVKELIIKDDKVCGVVVVKNKDEYNSFNNKREIFADKVIIACGGMSYPRTGSTGDGYILAKQAGHSIIDPKPSLVPIVSNDNWCKKLQGLSLKNISIKVKNQNKTIYEDFGEMLFTHFGVSGPVILSASSHMKDINKVKYNIIIDLKPALTEEKLDARIQRDFLKYINKDISNSLSELLPRKLIPVIIELLNIDPQTKCNQIKKADRLRLVKLLKNLTVSVKEFRPIDEAIVTSGGVKVSEIYPSTMESKLVQGLYFAGEVIDVDAYTGGYNLQIAFCTGFLAGISVSGGTVK